MCLQRIVLFAVVFISHSAIGQDLNKPFPMLEGSTVTDSIIAVPNDTKGKYTVLGLAFSKKSESLLETWLQPSFDNFIAPKLSKSPFNTFAYDVNIFLVPMFTGVNATAAKTAKKKALKKMDPKLYDFVLFYKGELKKYKSSLGLDKKDLPYFFVIDPKGNLVHAVSGAYSDYKMEEIEAILDMEEE